MKKFSAEHFEKKYRTLYGKLLAKNGFLDEVKKIRKRLTIPEEGFEDEFEVAQYFIKKMDEGKDFDLTFITYLDNQSRKNRESLYDISKENKSKMIDSFIREYKDSKKRKDLIGKAIFELGQDIIDHNQMIHLNLKIKGNKFQSSLSRETMGLISKYWGLDLLDEHIFGHLVEKYLLLGNYGVEKYIKGKTSCPLCRYIGVTHFSPERDNMEGEIGKKYIFNKETVKRLSLHYNSVFLVIKPYAQKEETIQYIKDNWDCLKEHIIEKNTFYKQFDVNPSKIKGSNFERNKLVYELYKLPKKEVLKIYKGKENFSGEHIYKETIISAILEEQHKISMTPDAVKKSASRFAKHSKIKMEPKDIGDI